MTEQDIAELIKLEENTLCSLPFEPQYKMRRIQLTALANRHRAMLADATWSDDGCTGQREIGCDGQTFLPARAAKWDKDCPSQGFATGGEHDDEVRVLVVESEPIVALLLRLVLENRGYSVRDVGSRAEALTESGRWAPDVIVTELPTTAAASVEFVTQLKAEVGTTDLRIVGTGRNMPASPGLDALFTRPFLAEEVGEKVASLIGEKADPPASQYKCLTATLDARMQVLCDIWRRLTAIGAQIQHCDSECDVVLYRIVTLLSLVDHRATYNALQSRVVSG